ncbi:MAG: 16S rRNA (guanine(966)-N(2))-methyltransferase RsmD [Actinomycetota bacterium]|nr:16S rRNA (guanine(966)-N(2))-methyltransferase RsmD [Actinomycetota bacterium]
MRVIAGKAKGTKLCAPEGMFVRPLLDRVKESIFSIIGESVEGEDILDLYAGSGSFGIEALSRGAAHVDFVERDERAISSLRMNLGRTHFESKARVVKANLPAGLGRVRGPYDLIFVDPPFRIGISLLDELFSRIEEMGILKDDGVLIYRHSRHSIYEPRVEHWGLIDRRDYGDSIVSIYGASLLESGKLT